MAELKNKKQILEDTGERMIPAFHKTHMVYGEHIVRYQAAMKLVTGKTVLDIAAGSGYGTALMAETAKQVFGVDVDGKAVAYAKKNYGAKNIDFILGNGISIPLEDNVVDVVVSFETLEHIEDYRTFMAEVKRVLKKDGLFLLSTPNEIEFPESNHFHIHEFEQKELEILVKEFFKNTKSYFQATWLYNALLDENDLGTEWNRPLETMNTAPVKTTKAIYFYMLCSNREITEVVTPLAAISEHFSERQRQEYEDSIRKHIEDQGAIIKHLENSVRDKDAAVVALQQQLDTIHNSRSWKLASKVKGAKNKIVH